MRCIVHNYVHIVKRTRGLPQSKLPLNHERFWYNYNYMYLLNCHATLRFCALEWLAFVKVRRMKGLMTK